MENNIIIFGAGYWGSKHLRVLSSLNNVNKIYVYPACFYINLHGSDLFDCNIHSFR